MEVKVLGSVSPYCKDNKNGPGFLVTSNNQKILLDCGSGVTRLLNMEEDLKDLVVIITHLHRDHYADLLSLSYASFVNHNLGLLADKVRVYVPRPDLYPDGEKLLPSSDFIYLSAMQKVSSYLDFRVYDTEDVMKFGDCEVSFALTPHDEKCNSIKVSDGESTLVYSGDTGYKENTLESFAKGSSLLICEATFLRNQKGLVDHHLCAFEAGKIAHKADVEKLMLTHFWPEIDKQEYVNEAKEEFFNTIAAEEGHVLKLVRDSGNKGK